MEICFATNNAHKISEIRQLLGDSFRILSLQEIGCHEELPETTGTIEGNSLQKAEYVYQKYSVPCFADDSGLEVGALGGEPGVDSAFYAGPQRSNTDNIDLLLKNLAPHQDRSAQFKTVITWYGQDGPHQFTGIISGQIGHSPSGAGGFGYDPVFIPSGSDKTFAQMTAEEKNKISHRGRAVSQLVLFLKKTPRTLNE